MKKEKDIFEKLEENEWITCVSHERDFPIGNVDELNPNYDPEFVEWKQKLHDKFNKKTLVAVKREPVKINYDITFKKIFSLINKSVEDAYNEAYQFVFDKIKKDTHDIWSDDEIHEFIGKFIVFELGYHYDKKADQHVMWIHPRWTIP